MFWGAIVWQTSTIWVSRSQPQQDPFHRRDVGPPMPKSVVSVRIPVLMKPPPLATRRVLALAIAGPSRQPRLPSGLVAS